MDKLWINPIVVGAVSLLALASSPVRGLRTGVVGERDRRRTETARRAHERALACWSFDGERDMWVPDLLRP